LRADVLIRPHDLHRAQRTTGAARQVHLAHSSCAKGSQDFVAVEDLPDH
jgi:hypothetical protein